MEHLLVLLVQNGHVLLEQLLLFSLVKGLGQTPAVVTVQPLASLAPRHIRITNLNRSTEPSGALNSAASQCQQKLRLMHNKYEDTFEDQA